MKKHILFLGAIVSFITLFTACSGSGSTKSGLSIDYMPFTEDEDGAIGMLDKDLKPLFSEEFEGAVSPVVDGVFWVEYEHDNFSLYKAEKKPTVINGCEELVSVGVMSEGIIPIVKKDSRITYIDKNGKEKFTLKPHKGKEIVAVNPYFIGGKAEIVVNEKQETIEKDWYGREYIAEHQVSRHGVINKEGKVIVEPIYDEVAINKDFVLAQIDEEKNSVIMFDNNGKKTKEFKNKVIVSMVDKERFLLRADNSYHLYNKSGEEIMKFTEKTGTPFIISGDYCIYYDKTSKVGIKNFKDNKEIIRPKYDMIMPVDENTFLVARGEKWKLIDKEDKEIKSFEGEYDKDAIFPLGFAMQTYGFNSNGWENYIVAVEDSENGYLTLFNKKGEEISAGKYHITAYYGLDDFDNKIRSDYKEPEPTETVPATEQTVPTEPTTTAEWSETEFVETAVESSNYENKIRNFENYVSRLESAGNVQEIVTLLNEANTQLSLVKPYSDDIRVKNLMMRYFSIKASVKNKV